MPHVTLFYVDNVSIKGLKTRYKNEEIPELSEIQRFIMKHLQNIDCILINLKYAELMLVIFKLMFCFLKIKLVKFICNENERHLNNKKIAKIV